MDIEEIKGIIKKISYSKENSHFRFINDENENDRKAKSNAIREQIQNYFINQTGKELDLTDEKIVMLLDNDRHYTNVYNYYYSNGKEDQKEAEDDLKSIFKTGEIIAKGIAAEILIQTMNPNDITIENLENLKYTEEVREQTDSALTPYVTKTYQRIPPIFYSKLEQYVNNIKQENIDEGLLNYLYENNYQGKILHPMLAVAYKCFCETKMQDEKISTIEDKLKKGDELIAFNYKEMSDLINHINKDYEYNEILDVQIKNCNDYTINLDSELEKLVLNIKENNSKNGFGVLIDKIKKAFSNKKNSKDNISNACQNIISTESSISGAIRSALDSTSTKDEFNKYINEVDSKNTLRMKMTNDYYESTESSEFQFQIECDEKLEAEYQNMFEEMYNGNYEEDFPDNISRLAYQMFCNKKQNEEKMRNINDAYSAQVSLIEYDGHVIDKLIDVHSELSNKQFDKKNNLNRFIFNLKSVITKVDELNAKQEAEDNKGLFATIKERINGMFSKEKRLPPGESQFESMFPKFKALSNFIGDIAFKTFNNNNSKDLIDEINAMLKRREDIINGKENVSKEIVEQKDNKTNSQELEDNIQSY